MLAPSNAWLRAGLGLKLNQIKLATRSYLRDRTDQATGAVTSYAIAAGLFAAAGVFLLAACLVGVAALFRWIEITYGRFTAFGVVAALLLVIAAICAAIAARRLRRRPPHFPSLTSRLRVAIKSSPVKPDQIEAVRDTAAAILLERATRSACRAPPAIGAIPARARQPRTARRADPDGDIAGLGRGPAPASGAANASLMPGRRSRPDDNLLLIAATTLLVLALQRYFQRSPLR